MTRESATLETLDRKMAELASFLSPTEIFRALLEGTVVGAPRAAIFLPPGPRTRASRRCSTP